MGKLVLQLIDSEDLAPKGISAKAKAVWLVLVTATLLSLGFTLGHELWPKSPGSLTPGEAAAILKSQNGYVGYSMIESSKGDMIMHTVFCPNCATEIVAVNLKFASPAPPAPGSRMALLASLAKIPTVASK